MPRVSTNLRLLNKKLKELSLKVEEAKNEIAEERMGRDFEMEKEAQLLQMTLNDVLRPSKEGFMDYWGDENSRYIEFTAKNVYSVRKDRNQPDEKVTSDNVDKLAKQVSDYVNAKFTKRFKSIKLVDFGFLDTKDPEIFNFYLTFQYK